MINKNHAKYSEYIEKCKIIAEQQEKELDAVEKTRGFDGPETAIYKKYAKKLKELQKEYSFLFEES
jgi:septation ring formation regulator EzrA